MSLHIHSPKLKFWFLRTTYAWSVNVIAWLTHAGVCFFMSAWFRFHFDVDRSLMQARSGDGCNYCIHIRSRSWRRCFISQSFNAKWVQCHPLFFKNRRRLFYITKQEMLLHLQNLLLEKPFFKVLLNYQPNELTKK